MTDFVRTYTERFNEDGSLFAIQTINPDGSESNIPIALDNADYQAYLASLNPTEQPTCATKIAWYNANRLTLPRLQGTL